MIDTASRLAAWAHGFKPNAEDMALADRALTDTMSVTLAARGHPLVDVIAGLPEPARWAALGHVLDFDDLHMKSTAHVSVVCVPAVLAAGGDARAYLAAAGVMARLGAMMGWDHYSSGWHATCTAGAPAAAVAAALSLGLDEAATATAIALAVPAAGGVQRAFGSDGKSLQVGFAVEAGLRAAHLAAAGASADPSAMDEWLRLVAPAATALETDGPAVPGGLAMKLYPCCYALQRPISAIQQLRDESWRADQIRRVTVATPEAALAPLIHHRPLTGLQAKFSLEYAIAAAALDNHPGFASFTTDAVLRPAARDLMERVEIVPRPGGEGLLDGECTVEVELRGGPRHGTSLTHPPGAPSQPPLSEQLNRKLRDCGADVPPLLTTGLTWSGAAELLTVEFPTPAIQRAATRPVAAP